MNELWHRIIAYLLAKPPIPPFPKLRLEDLPAPARLVPGAAGKLVDYNAAMEKFLTNVVTIVHEDGVFRGAVVAGIICFIVGNITGWKTRDAIAKLLHTSDAPSQRSR